MANENVFLLHALSMGIFITFIYDLLRIFRRVIPHRNFLISLEDLFFWIYCAAKVFLLMYHESNGTLRWFAILGALAGMLAYRKLVSPILVKYASLFLQAVLRLALKLGKALLRPWCRLYQKIRAGAARQMRKRAVKRLKRKEILRNFAKKKLTLLKKVLNMNT